MSHVREVAMTPDEAQEYVIKQGHIKIPGVSAENLAEKDLKSFLERFIHYYGGAFGTCFHDGTGVDRKQQTRKGAARTITDMAAICRYYFPNENVVTVRNTLLELVQEGKMGTTICYGIKRRIFYRNVSNSCREYRDEFGWKFNKPQRRQPGMKKPEKQPLVKVAAPGIASPAKKAAAKKAAKPKATLKAPPKKTTRKTVAL